MNYLEEYRILRRRVANYTAGERTFRGPSGGQIKETTVDRWRQAELRIAKLEDYFARHGIAVQ